MLYEDTKLRPLRIVRLTVDDDDAVPVNHPVNDMLDKVCLLEELRLGLDFILDLLHVPSDQILLLDLFAIRLLSPQIACEHLTNPLILIICDLHLTWPPCCDFCATCS